jgi:hypothetical protein
MDSSTASAVFPNLSPRRSSVSASVMGLVQEPSRPQSPSRENSPLQHNSPPTHLPREDAAQYVSRGSYLVLKQQLVDERITYLREVMALRQQVMDMEAGLKRYYEMAIERHAHTYSILQGSTSSRAGGGGGGGGKASSGALSPTVTSPAFGRRTSLYALDAPSSSSLAAIQKDESVGPAIFDLNTSQLISDGRTAQLASPARSQSPRPGPTAPSPQVGGTRPIVHLYPPEPPVYTPVSLQLVPAERLAAALSSAAVLEEHQELHKRAILQLEATHRGELSSQQQKYDLLVAEHERQERDRKQAAALQEAQTVTYRTRCRVDAFKAVEKRLHVAEADREQLAEHVRVLQSKLADVQAQLASEKEAASETSNQLAAVRQQQGLVLHERAELRSALIAIQKDRNRLEHVGGPYQRGMNALSGSGTGWSRLAESSRRDDAPRAVQFTGGGTSLMGAVTGALQRAKEKQLNAAPSPTSSPRTPKAPRVPHTPRRPEAARGQEDALFGVRARH